MADRPPEISVVIPCHNGRTGLDRCLHSLRQQELDPDRFEILVVDNASTPPLSEQGLVTDGGPAIRLVREARLGLHFARNTGASQARAPLLAYTDDDVLVSPAWLSSLLDAMSDPAIAAAGGPIRARWEMEPPEWVNRYAPGYLSLLEHGDEARNLDTPDLYGCNLVVRRDALLSVGGFHPESFGANWMGDGETGMLVDLLAAGYSLRFHPEALVYHCIPASRCTETYLKRRFQNQAGCDAYTWYRSERPGRRELLRSGWQHRQRARRFRRQSRNSHNPDAQRHARFLTAYHLRRWRYAWRLMCSAAFREQVLDKHWF